MPKLRPSALIISAMVSVVTIALAIILSWREEVDSQLFTVLITAGVVGLVNLAVKIVEGPSVPADTHERLVSGRAKDEDED